MQTVDEITRNFVLYKSTCRYLVSQTEDHAIFGYTTQQEKLVRIAFWDPIEGCVCYTRAFLNSTHFWASSCGCYASPINMPEGLLYQLKYDRGNERGYSYSFAKKYEACQNFNVFAGKQEVLGHTLYALGKYMKYSFGLEFETSMGIIPEEVCLRDGLIPLRDGSISGIEYSTVVMQGNEGINLLDQQLQTLRKFTFFDKECSLHVHLGGFPLEPDAIFRVYSQCYRLAPELSNILPEYTFRGNEYKKTGKNYCKHLPAYSNFNRMYEGLVGRHFFGSFEQPHPADITREHKWNVHTRYYAVNFINLLCYKVNKTIEFRFLRPTYNFDKIRLWLYIFNGILLYAEKGFPKVNNLQAILEAVYPEELHQPLREGLVKLKMVTELQSRNGDRIGADLTIENQIFSNSSI